MAESLFTEDFRQTVPLGLPTLALVLACYVVFRRSGRGTRAVNPVLSSLDDPHRP